MVVLFGAAGEIRSRCYHTATRTAGTKRPTGAFFRFAHALFESLDTKKNTTLLGGVLFVMLYHCRFLNPRLKNTMCMSEFSGLFQLFSNFFDRRIQTLPIGRMKNRYTKTLFFLWHLVRIRGCSFQKVSHDLIELRGVLRGDDRRIGL